MQKARRHPDKSELRPLVSIWFQDLFTPLLGVLFTFPLRYWFAIGLSGVFSLTRWCWPIQTEFLRFRPTQDTATIYATSFKGLSPAMAGLPRPFKSLCKSFMQSYYPILAVTRMVWAVSRSLATTWEITVVFSSCRYLDVSVPCVRLPPINRENNASSMHWVVPFGYLRIISYVPIPVAFRSLSRPSSPLRA